MTSSEFVFLKTGAPKKIQSSSSCRLVSQRERVLLGEHRVLQIQLEDYGGSDF